MISCASFQSFLSGKWTTTKTAGTYLRLKLLVIWKIYKPLELFKTSTLKQMLLLSLGNKSMVCMQKCTYSRLTAWRNSTSTCLYVKAMYQYPWEVLPNVYERIRCA